MTVVACNEKVQDDVIRLSRKPIVEGFQSGRELIPCLKSGALEIDYEQLADSG